MMRFSSEAPEGRAAYTFSCGRWAPCSWVRGRGRAGAEEGATGEAAAGAWLQVRGTGAWGEEGRTHRRGRRRSGRPRCGPGERGRSTRVASRGGGSPTSRRFLPSDESGDARGGSSFPRRPSQSASRLSTGAPLLPIPGWRLSWHFRDKPLRRLRISNCRAGPVSF